MKSICALCFIVLTAVSVTADPIPVVVPERSAPVSFEKDILPVFRANCLACHSKTERQGELVLESPADILKGGDNGPAVVAGRPQDSLLLKVASHADEPVMPPEDNDVRYLKIPLDTV